MACVAVAVTGRAQERLEANDFSIDAVTTPVLGSSRIVGLGGAFTSLAEGIDAVPFNPAAYAARPPWELDAWEWDLSLSLSFPGAFSSVDLFNHGRGRSLGVGDAYALGLGGRLQFADLGLGVLFQRWTFSANDVLALVDVITVHYGLGYAFFDGQLVLGVGARSSILDITSVGETLVSFSGTGAEIGGVLRVTKWPFRVGLALRTPVDSTIVPDDEAGPVPEQVGGFVLPRSVALPWEIQAGVAFQFGDRAINLPSFRIKNIAAARMRAYEAERCERERRQVLEELAARGVPAPALRCPDLAVRARDPAWRRRERERQVAAAEEAERLQDRHEDTLYALMEEVYESRPRRYVLVSVDVLVQGPTPDGVGVDAFLLQERRERGTRWHGGFRLGVEGEPLHDRLKVRAGTYLEPGRYVGVRPRLHGTFGFDVRLFEVFGLDLKAGFTIDGARHYVNWGLGVGVWH